MQPRRPRPTKHARATGWWKHDCTKHALASRGGLRHHHAVTFEGPVELTARENLARCAYCHDPLVQGAGVTGCPACGTQLHDDCVTQRCPTLGCAHSFAEAGERFHPSEGRGPSAFRRAMRWVGGVGLPLVCFGFNEAIFQGSATLTPAPNWRGDGGLFFWLGQFRVADAQRPLYPLVLWSILAISAHQRGRRGPWIRVGLSGGIILSVVFCLGYAHILPASFMMLIFVVGLLGLGPFLALITYALARWRYAREAPPPDSKDAVSEGPGYVPWAIWTWLGLGGGAITVQQMNQLWEALPTEDPNCFIATAAARGAVPATAVRFATGRIVPVTRQLRTLKAGELVVVTLLPRTHRALRTVYDRLGPRLAAGLGPVTATLAWGLLLPAQLATELALRALFRSAPRLLARTYG